MTDKVKEVNSKQVLGLPLSRTDKYAVTWLFITLQVAI